MKIIKPEEGSRLEQLLAHYDELKDAADDAAEKLKSCVDAIKVEAIQRAPQEARLQVDSPMLRQPLNVSYVESWRLDPKRIRAEDPVTYARFAIKGGTWQLKRAPRG